MPTNNERQREPPAGVPAPAGAAQSPAESSAGHDSLVLPHQSRLVLAEESALAQLHCLSLRCYWKLTHSQSRPPWYHSSPWQSLWKLQWWHRLRYCWHQCSPRGGQSRVPATMDV